MRTDKIAGLSVQYYDSIDELPVIRFQKWNKLMIVESGVGSTLNDVNSHIKRIKGYMKSDQLNAQKELDNLRQNLILIVNGISPKHLAFAALVKSINGKPVTDLSDEGLKAVTARLNPENINRMDLVIDSLKKKLKKISIYISRTNSNPLQ